MPSFVIVLRYQLTLFSGSSVLTWNELQIDFLLGMPLMNVVCVNMQSLIKIILREIELYVASSHLGISVKVLGL